MTAVDDDDDDEDAADVVMSAVFGDLLNAGGGSVILVSMFIFISASTGIGDACTEEGVDAASNCSNFIPFTSDTARCDDGVAERMNTGMGDADGDGKHDDESAGCDESGRLINDRGSMKNDGSGLPSNSRTKCEESDGDSERDAAGESVLNTCCIDV